MLKKVVLFALLLIPAGAFAQEAKIAYVNYQEVIKAMPEYTQLLDSLERMQNAIQNELKTMSEEYDQKYSAFMKESETLVETIKVRRLQEIQDIEQRAQNFSQQSQQTLQQTQQNLFVPIQQKVNTAVASVGEENNFTYILEANSLLFFNSKTSIDATPLVKKKLGLK